MAKTVRRAVMAFNVSLHYRSIKATPFDSDLQVLRISRRVLMPSVRNNRKHWPVIKDRYKQWLAYHAEQKSAKYRLMLNMVRL